MSTPLSGRITILDTRKTTPTLRALEKYAVRAGGGSNHRSGLDDGILIKDNHVRLAGGVVEAVKRMKAARQEMLIEVEAQSLADVEARSMRALTSSCSTTCRSSKSIRLSRASRAAQRSRSPAA